MAESHVAIYSCADEDVPHWCLYAVDDDGNGRVFEALGILGQGFKYVSRPEDIVKSADLAEYPSIYADGQ